jgi:hypothetical protein
MQQHGDYRVVETHLPNEPPLIYPATFDALRQLSAIRPTVNP